MQPLVSHDFVIHFVQQVLLYGWLACELLLQIRTRLLGGRGASDWTFYIVVASITAAIAGGSRLADIHASQLGGGRAIVAVGLAVFMAGVLLRLWAMVKLGRLFTFRVAIQTGHQIVRSGPYRYVRHPSYSGLLAACLGLGLALENWLSLLVMIVLPASAIVLRIIVEERALRSALGADYRDYSATTPRLLPLVW